MKDKKGLLSFSSNLRFIFSHSALREGWDNPNVFQICTLRERGSSKITPRQQIGRGLRLCVNQQGERVYGHEVNTLSVIANESWEQFVQELQTEIEKETGIKFGVIEEYTFSDVVLGVEDGHTQYLGQDRSSQLYKHFVGKGYVDNRGKVQDTLRIALKDNTVDIPEGFDDNVHVYKQIISNLKSAAGKLEIKNKDEKKHRRT